MKQEQEIFEQAMALSSREAREGFLLGACGQNRELRRNVDELLAAFHDAGELDFLQTGERLQEGQTAPADARIDQGPGTIIGRYKLLQKVGEGGCGVVYMAEQSEPVRRRVALKVIKLGMDTKSVIARFESERQALALMDHPNIAKVLDGGATDEGRPYFVMELVRGVKITEYCDQANLSTRDRLDLFIKVCQAIQHAHQKGIIHRDIKPSNILVTLHDGVPVPKVIDFGIAKATTDQRLTDKTLFTALEQFIGTPAYMSPEQAEMSGLDIDTRCDIYSLGVLLYELLAGSTPFDAKELLASGIDAMRKTIREKEPVRPSTKLSQTLVADDVRRRTSGGTEESASSRRRLQEQLQQLKGDLDWIVMKCLEKDRARRYETASGLASDLQRHLNNEAVLARPASAAYRFQKLVRRNKLVFTAGAAVALALVVGLGVSTWQAIRAEANARALRKSLYTADMKLAQVSLDEHNRGRALELVEKYARRRAADSEPPNPSSNFKPDFSLRGESPDLRGWEWRYLWRLTRGDESAILHGHSNRVLSVAFSPRGRLLLSGSTDRTARLWDVDAQREIHRFTFTNTVEAVAFSPDGKQFAIATGNTVAMGAAETLAPLRPLFTHPDSVLSLAFSPDGKTLASASSVVKLWDLASTQETGTLDASGGPIAFSADGRLLAACGKNSSLKLWSLADRRELPLLKSHENSVRSLTFSPTAGTLASASEDGSIKLWNPVSPQPLATFSGPWFDCWAVTFSPDGKVLATGWSDQTIKLWDIASHQQITTLKGHAKEVLSLAFSADGKVLASGGKDGTIRLWNPDVRPVEAGYTKLADSTDIPVVSSDAKTILTFNGTNGVSLWDLRSARELSRFALPPGVISIAVHPGGDMLALAKRDGALSLWNTSVSNERSLDGHTRVVGSLAFSRDGRRLAGFGADGTIVLFDMESGRETGSIQASPGEIAGLWFSPDGRLLASQSEVDWTVSLWDVGSRKRVATLRGHKEPVSGTAFSPDGKLLATGSWDGSARLWEVTTGRQIGAPITGSFLALFSVGFSPDGRRLVAGTGEGHVVIWDTDTMTEITTLKGHEYGLVVHGAFFSDQDTLVSMRRNEVFVWRAASLAQTDAIQGTRLK